MKNFMFLLIFFITTNACSSDTNHTRNENISTENVQYLSAESYNKLNQYLSIVHTKKSDWSSNTDQIYTLENKSNTNQLYSVDLKSGKKKQVTDFKEPIGHFISCPNTINKQSIIFLSDTGGNEDFQLYWYTEQNKKITKISTPNTRNTSPVCSYDGSLVAWQVTEKNKNNIVISKLDTNYQNTLLTAPNNETWVPIDWSLDNKTILILRYISNYESELHILDINTRSLKQINPKDKKISYVPFQAKFYKNNNIIFISDQNSNFNELISYNIVTSESLSLTPNIKNDVEQFKITSDNRYIFYVTNNNGYSELFRLDLTSNVTKQISSLPTHSIINNFSIKYDNKQILFTIESATSPSSVFIYDVDHDSFFLVADNTKKHNDNPTKLVSPTLISYPSFDKIHNTAREIPAFIYKPNSTPPYPVIIYIHGGPEVQERPSYSGIYQYWLDELKAAIILPNVRGSSGYGKEYLNLDNGFKREDAVKDIGYLLEWIKTQKDLDKNNIGIIGKSYGGFMSLSAAADFADQIKASVDIVGISNFVTFLESTSEYRRDLRRAEYGDERNPEMRSFLNAISPLSKIDKIKKPLFIIQGLNDPRVPITESEQMRDALRNTGIEVWYMLANNEGHGYTRKENIMTMHSAITTFWKKHLKNN